MPAHHQVKLKCEQTAGKYIPGTTQDVSDGGALLMLEHPRLLVSEEFVEATIVRSLGHGDTQHVAVRYARPQRLAEAI